jgi:hypothetical protein
VRLGASCHSRRARMRLMGVLHLLALLLMRHQKRAGHRRLGLLRRGMLLRIRSRLLDGLLLVGRVVHLRLRHLSGRLPITMDAPRVWVGLGRLHGSRGIGLRGVIYLVGVTSVIHGCGGHELLRCFRS